MSQISQIPCGVPDGTDLPEGWALAVVSDYFDSWGGATPSTSESLYWGGSVPWISSKDVKQWRLSCGTDFVTKEALLETRLRLCPVGSVLVVIRSGVLVHTLPVTITDAEVVINQDLKAFTSPDRQFNEWLALALRSMADDILTDNRKDGTTVQSIRFDQLKNMTVPVPPAPEQERILATVERLLAQVNKNNERLAMVVQILKRFRQSVLAAACSGRLTADWRAGQADLDPASSALEAMLTERRQRWQNVNGDRRYRESVTPSLDGLDSLPGTWCWATFDQCAEDITVGHVGPMRDQYTPRGIPFLRSQNVRPLRFDDAGLVHISEHFHEKLRKSTLHGGELLVVRSGANTGDCCVCPDGLSEANCADLVITRPLSGLVAQYAAIYVNSPDGRARLNLGEVGIAQPHFNIGAMREKAFPLPPLREQVEIVCRVKALLKLADAIEARVASATTRVEKLTRAILAKAFRGELVPTEAELARSEGRDYEPASVLLERIRAERAGAADNPKLRRGRPSQPTEPQAPATTPKQPEPVLLADADDDDREPVARRDHASHQDRRQDSTNRDDSATVPIDQVDREEVMAVIRDVFASGGARTREESIRDIAHALGYRRTGRRIQDCLDDYVRTAVLRGILQNENGQLSLLVHQIDEYTLDHLVHMLVAGMGSRWWEREEIIRATARWLGFRRTGPLIQKALKSAINAAIRRGLLESKGDTVRRL